MLLKGQQFCCTVGGAIRNDDDLFNVGVIEAKEMLNLSREQRDTVMHGEYDTHAGGDRSDFPRPWPQPCEHPNRYGVSHVGVENADQRQPEDDLHWAPLRRMIVLIVSNMIRRSRPIDMCLT